MIDTKIKFQLTVNSDSILVSQAPGKNKSRVILANLGEQQLKQIAQSIINSELEDKFIEMFEMNEHQESII